MVEFEKSKLNKIINARPFNISTIPSFDLVGQCESDVITYLKNKYPKSNRYSSEINDVDFYDRSYFSGNGLFDITRESLGSLSLSIKAYKKLEAYRKKVKQFDYSHFHVRLNEGKNENEGYVTYLYDNGQVVSLKYFENDVLGHSSNSNIIITDLDTFFETAGVYDLSLEEMKNSEYFMVKKVINQYQKLFEEYIDLDVAKEIETINHQEISKILSLHE